MVALAKAMMNLPLFALVACRMSGLALIAPIFSSTSLAVRTKIAVVTMLTLIMFPLAVGSAGRIPTKAAALLPLFATELGVGLLMGFAAAMVVAAAQMGGNLAAQQMGLALARTAAPDTGVSSTAVSVFLGMLSLLLILTMGAHRWLVEILAWSYRVAPLGEVRWNPLVFRALAGNFSNMFVLAVRMVAPLIAVLFLVNVMIALMAKAAPRMQILMAAYPAKVIVGVIMLVLAFPLVYPVIREACAAMRTQMIHYLRLL